jgi:urease accessory protein
MIARSSASGSGALDVARVDGATAVIGARAEAPLKLLVPRPRGPSAWAYAATFGGGLVEGDRVDLDLRVGPGAALMLSTQATTKVYRSEDRPASQELRARVEEGALLALIPDPVCCFEGARYRQRQRVDLAPGAGLVLVDGLVSGRAARGERWRFASYRSVTEVRVGDRLAVREALRLEDAPGDRVIDRMGRFDALAFAVILGPSLAPLAASIRARVEALPLPRARGRARLLASAGAVECGTVLRVAGEHIEEVSAFVRRALDDLPGLLGDDPWARKW